MKLYKENTAIFFALLMHSTTSLALGYKIIPEINHGHKFSLQNNFYEVRDFEKDNFEWGLALSGGGIRSSAYSIGVMKSLYDQGVLQKIDIISAVSGGGYAAYWLLSSEVESNNKNHEFGSKAFSKQDDVFVYNTCKLMTSSNLITYPQMFSASLPFKPGTMGDYYGCKIERTYGWQDISSDENTDINACLQGPSKSKTIDSYLEKTKAGSIPYFIFNATLVSPYAESGWEDGLYEFTPIFNGNDKYGYKEWGVKNDNPPLPLSKISAISGAAIKFFLKQDIENPHKKSIKKETIKLTDGGHSENLGAIALIKRGVKNIIVSDAELDSDLTFEGYYILKDRLKAWGLTLEKDFLDKRHKVADNSDEWWESDTWWAREQSHNKETEMVEGNFIARVYKTDDPKKETKSTLYYIKSSIVGDVKSDAKEMYSMKKKEYGGQCLMDMYNNPSSIETENAKMCYKFGYLDGKCKKDNSIKISCEDVKGLGIKGVEWIKQNAVIRINNDFGGDFPHDSTADQSYYIDQFTSYMGLGYLQTEKFNFNDFKN